MLIDVDRNIAYRNLKPETVLLDNDGYIRLTGMGFAKRVPFINAQVNPLPPHLIRLSIYIYPDPVSCIYTLTLCHICIVPFINAQVTLTLSPPTNHILILPFIFVYPLCSRHPRNVVLTDLHLITPTLSHQLYIYISPTLSYICPDF